MLEKNSMPKVVLTAGFDRALNVIALAELLRRRNVQITGILVVSPFQIKRLKKYIAQHGFAALKKAANRMIYKGSKSNSQKGTLPLDIFLNKNDISEFSLKSWAEKNNIPYHWVSSLNNEDALNTLKTIDFDGILYGGGGILHSEIIALARGRILNAHSGPLPYVRGMNACEWSILLEYPPAITIHYINRGIDTGAILDEIPISVEDEDDIEILRSKCVVAGIKGLMDNIDNLFSPFPTIETKSIQYKQCYVMAPAIKEFLSRKLLQGK